MFFAAILLEIMSLYWSIAEIGFLQTTGLLLSFAILGFFLLRKYGFRTLSSPSQPVEPGNLAKIAAGLLFMIPGFFSDFVGILILIPLSRHLLWHIFRKRIERAQYEGRVFIFKSTPFGTSSPPIRDVTPPRIES